MEILIPEMVALSLGAQCEDGMPRFSGGTSTALLILNHHTGSAQPAHSVSLLLLPFSVGFFISLGTVLPFS